MAHDVFISYSSKDASVAKAICHFMENRGIRVWIAPRDILPGLVWSEAIVDAISSSAILVLVFSHDSNKSSQVNREVELAVSREIIIIPFRIEDIPLSKSLEYFIGPHHWLDALTPPLEKHIQTLVDKVELLLGREIKDSDRREAAGDGNPLLAEIHRITKNWVDSGCPYFILEGISPDLKALLRHPTKDIEGINDDEALLLLMASIHFGGNWISALDKCQDKRRAAALLMNAMQVSYMRPRFRALCALQACGREEIQKLPAENDTGVDASLRTLIERYVLTARMDVYLRKIKEAGDPDLSKKAAEVLREFMQYTGKASEAGSVAGLPLP